MLVLLMWLIGLTAFCIFFSRINVYFSQYKN